LEHLTWCAAYHLQGHNIAVNALFPSKAILTPGLSYYAREFDTTSSGEEFARAAVELAAQWPVVLPTTHAPHAAPQRPRHVLKSGSTLPDALPKAVMAAAVTP
jgi:NAD(P)-dependent dehydrogenase (short-subunit alcohol dehydrogenase family)